MYCVWLTFDSPDLSEIILKLAQKYNSPVFQPHCTLVGKTDVSLPKLKTAIISLVSNHKMIDLNPLKIDYTDYLWRALYIELKEKHALTKWHEYISKSLSINYDKDFLPHISLMYNSISVREKKKISGKIELKSVYKIQSIRIIDCGEKVDDWRTVFELTMDD
jgi:2'-5' RNA ligase